MWNVRYTCFDRRSKTQVKPWIRITLVCDSWQLDVNLLTPTRKLISQHLRRKALRDSSMTLQALLAEARALEVSEQQATDNCQPSERRVKTSLTTIELRWWIHLHVKFSCQVLYESNWFRADELWLQFCYGAEEYCCGHFGNKREGHSWSQRRDAQQKLRIKSQAESGRAVKDCDIQVGDVVLVKQRWYGHSRKRWLLNTSHMSERWKVLWKES